MRFTYQLYAHRYELSSDLPMPLILGM